MMNIIDNSFQNYKQLHKICNIPDIDGRTTGFLLLSSISQVPCGISRGTSGGRVISSMSDSEISESIRL